MISLEIDFVKAYQESDHQMGISGMDRRVHVLLRRDLSGGSDATVEITGEDRSNRHFVMEGTIRPNIGTNADPVQVFINEVPNTANSPETSRIAILILDQQEFQPSILASWKHL